MEGMGSILGRTVHGKVDATSQCLFARLLPCLFLNINEQKGDAYKLWALGSEGAMHLFLGCTIRCVRRESERGQTARERRRQALAPPEVRAPAPWSSVAHPELRTIFGNDAANGVPSPRGLARATLSVSWEAPTKRV